MPSNIYFGAPESEQQHLGLRLSVTRYHGDAVIPAHEHDNAYICIGTTGGFVECSGRNEREIHAHDLVYHPPGHRHSDRFGRSGGRCVNVEITPEWFSTAAGIRTPTTPIYANDPALRRIGRALIREALQPQGPAPLAFDGLLPELLTQFRGPTRRRSERPPSWLLTVRDRLRDTCRQSHRLAALAENAGVHPVHLAREFNRQFGCTVHGYLLHCRIDTAAELLVDGDRSLADIALELGFNHQSHFTRVFTEHTGVTPGAYRRQAHSRRR